MDRPDMENKGRIMFGVDYYPEHWPKHRWKSDAILMKKAGLQVVRLAEFAWEKIEPEDGVFDFTWLDDAVELLVSEGLKVVMGTPTAAPPAWLVEKHPEILPVRQDGTRMSFGGRHHDCQSNEVYRESVEIIVREMAGHFRNTQGVIGWQTDNEFGNSHMHLCYCDSCRNHFHLWLQKKYTTIEELNHAWGTVFWSQTYTGFDQIPIPLATPNSHNPALLLDWRRFASDLIVAFQKVQIDILREECPDHFITHNYMGFSGKVDYFDLSEGLDFVSHDQYPVDFNSEGVCAPAYRIAMPLDFIRGVKGKPFWIMEQQSGPSGWEVIGPTPRPGQLRLWATQSAARGAETIVFFRWRSCLFGTEQYWHGILPHSGNPGRRYTEVADTIRDLKPVLRRFAPGTAAKSKIAMLFSYDQMWAFDIQPHHPDLKYLEVLQTYYRALHARNVAVDFVSDTSDLTGYEVVIAPMQFLLNKELEGKLEAFVKNGGHLVSGMRTGVKDWNNRVLPETLPGPYAELFGIRIDDYDTLRKVDQGVRYGDIEEPVTWWADIIELDGARSLAHYSKDFYANTPAITEFAGEGGKTFYIGTVLGPDVMDAFVGYLLDTVGISGLFETPDGVEAVVRSDGSEEILFVMNHTDQAQIVDVPEGWAPVLMPKSGDQNQDISGEDLVLPAFEIALFEKRKS